MKTCRPRPLSNKILNIASGVLIGFVSATPSQRAAAETPAGGNTENQATISKNLVGKPKVGGGKQSVSKKRAIKPLTEGTNYLIIPLKGAQTDLQKTLISSRKGAEVIINGTAIVNADGTIKGNALLLSQLRKDLKPMADRRKNHLDVHIYYDLVGKSRNAKDMLYFSLQGFGRHAGFFKTKVFNHFQGQRFRFENLVAARKKSLAEVEEEGANEPESGDKLVKVYPVRTALSRRKSADADCVVVIVPRIVKGPMNALPPKIVASIKQYVSKLQVSRKGKILFKVTSMGKGRQTVDWLSSRGAADLARRLGYENASVRHSPY